MVGSLLCLKLQKVLKDGALQDSSQRQDHVYVLDLERNTIKYLLSNVRLLLRLDAQLQSAWTLQDKRVCKLQLVELQ